MYITELTQQDRSACVFSLDVNYLEAACSHVKAGVDHDFNDKIYSLRVSDINVATVPWRIYNVPLYFALKSLDDLNVTDSLRVEFHKTKRGFSSCL